MFKERPRLFRDMIAVRDVDDSVLDVEPEAEIGFVRRSGLEPAVLNYSHRHRGLVFWTQGRWIK